MAGITKYSPCLRANNRQYIINRSANVNVNMSFDLGCNVRPNL